MNYYKEIRNVSVVNGSKNAYLLFLSNQLRLDPVQIAALAFINCFNLKTVCALSLLTNI